jgi:hypothetical protein
MARRRAASAVTIISRQVPTEFKQSPGWERLSQLIKTPVPGHGFHLSDDFP